MGLDHVDVHQDNARAVDVYFARLRDVVDDVPATAVDAQQVTVGATTVDAAAITDAVDDQWYALVAELLTLEEHWSTRNRASGLVLDRARALDATTSYRAHLVESAGLAADELLDERSTAWLESRARALGDIFLATARATNSFGDTLRARDAALEVQRSDVSDAARAVDLIVERGASREWLYVEARATTDVYERAVYVDMPVSAARAQCVVEQRADARGPLLIDEALAYDALLADQSSAWTSNTDTWAMSRWELSGVESLAVLNSVIYGVGSHGLVCFDGPDDLGAPVVSTVTGMLSDFDDPRLKELLAMRMGYRSERPLTAKMTVTYDGRESEYEYTAPPRAAGSWVPGRIPLGRGLRSRYVRYVISNVEGADFAVDGLSLEVVLSTRRV